MRTSEIFRKIVESIDKVRYEFYEHSNDLRQEILTVKDSGSINVTLLKNLNLADVDVRGRVIFLINTIDSAIEAIKKNEEKYILSRKKLLTILELQQEIRSILTRILQKYSASEFLQELNTQLNHYSIWIAKKDISGPKFQAISTIENLLAKHPGVDQKTFFFDIANRFTYKWWYGVRGKGHHVNSFCTNRIITSIPPEELDATVDKLIEIFKLLESEYYFDISHFFAAYAAYSTQKNTADHTDLRIFLRIYKTITTIDTNAYFNKILYDIPEDMHLAFWYTAGGDILQDLGRNNGNFCVPQILGDFHILSCLQQDITYNDFNIIVSLQRYFDKFKNKDLSYTSQPPYFVVREMIEHANVQNWRLKAMREVWGLGMKYHKLWNELRAFFK